MFVRLGEEGMCGVCVGSAWREGVGSMERLGDVWYVGKESGDERGVERVEGVKAGM